MADRQRWLWAAWRIVNRNRWTLFGGFAALTIAGNAVTARILFYNDPKQTHSSPGDFFQLPVRHSAQGSSQATR